MRQLPLAMRLRERAVFDSFVVGQNAAALAQLQTAATRTGTRVCWLAGPSGAGKTHLLQASCTCALEAGRQAAYLPLRELLEYGPGTLQGWQDAELVALDDIATVIGRRAWEEALFALYRAVEERGASLVAAAQVRPASLPFALPDLASRFAGALLLTLHGLDEQEQRLALQGRARARGLELPEDSARYLQRHFRRDLPTLCRLLDTIDTAALQAQRRLTVPFIREVLERQPPPAE
jgi:DnaA family protein